MNKKTLIIAVLALVVAGGAYKTVLAKPKEKAKKIRSLGATPDAWNTVVQLSTIQVQLSGVSSQRIGSPLVPLVWQKRV